MRKRKKKPAPNLEFVSPYPLEDCVWQLQNFPGVGENYPVKTVAIVQPIDDENWKFTIEKSYHSFGFLNGIRFLWEFLIESSDHRHEYTYLKIQAMGTLKRMPTQETLVIGTVANCTEHPAIKQTISLIVSCIIFAIVIAALKDALILGLVITAVITTPIIYWGYFTISHEDRFRYVLAGHIKRVLSS